MSDPSPLILDRFECGMWASVPRARPDAAFVLSYGDGRVRVFARAPGFADRAGSKWCYVVDKSQRFSSGELRIPARGGVYFFSTWYDAAWQVTDPEAVVRANLRFGEPVVSGYLKSALWPLGRGYDARDAKQVEEAAAQLLQPPMAVGSGLTLNGLTVRLSIDTRQADNATAGDEEVRRREQVRARVEELRRLVGNDDPFLLMHLAEHPGDTAAALQLINQSRQQDVQNRITLLDKLLQHGIITDVDGDWLRPMVLGGGAPAIPAGPTAATATPAVGSGAAPALPSSTGSGQWAVPVLGAGSSAPPAALPAGGSSGPVPPASSGPPAPPVVSVPPRANPNGPRDRPRAAPSPTVPTPTAASAAVEIPAPAPEAPRDQPAGARRDPAASSGGSSGVVGWKPLKKRPPS